MSLLNSYTRVSRRHPCPVCAHTDWCLIDIRDPTAPISAICPRVESPRRVGTAGFLHLLKQDVSPVRGCCTTITVRTSRDFSRLATTLHDQAAGDATATLSQMLGVSMTSLRRLGVGYVHGKQLATFNLPHRSECWTFPMTTADGRVVGLRLRTANGRKFALTGSRNALFMPTDIPLRTERLLIAEGESDTAALLDLNFSVVGRPGARGCESMLALLVRRLCPLEVVVMSDNDAVGGSGADSLATCLRLACPRVRVISPPEGIKDAREWITKGATQADVLARIVAAPLIEVTIKSKGAC